MNGGQSQTQTMWLHTTQQCARQGRGLLPEGTDIAELLTTVQGVQRCLRLWRGAGHTATWMQLCMSGGRPVGFQLASSPVDPVQALTSYVYGVVWAARMWKGAKP